MFRLALRRNALARESRTPICTKMEMSRANQRAVLEVLREPKTRYAKEVNDRVRALIAWLVGCAVVLAFIALLVAIIVYMGQ